MAEVERLILEHDEIVRSGRLQENHMMFLWQLLNLDLWLESLERGNQIGTCAAVRSC